MQRLMCYNIFPNIVYLSAIGDSTDREPVLMIILNCHGYFHCIARQKIEKASRDKKIFGAFLGW